jgi:hypothetical protein
LAKDPICGMVVGKALESERAGREYYFGAPQGQEAGCHLATPTQALSRKTVMHMNVLPLTAPAPGTQPFEIVERKGLGHPDTICDALAEAFSRGLARFYIERFGRILHHNVDKALLCGGIARAAFGGGEVLEPIEIHLAGRATREFQGVKIPVEEIALTTSRKWLQENLALDPREHVRIVPHVRPTSADLATLFDGGGAFRRPLAMTLHSALARALMRSRRLCSPWRAERTE